MRAGLTVREVAKRSGIPVSTAGDYFSGRHLPQVKLVGMFTRMGFRPGNGWADALHAVYLGGSRVAFTYGRRTDLSPGRAAVAISELVEAGWVDRTAGWYERRGEA